MSTKYGGETISTRDGSFDSEGHIYKDNVCYSKESGQPIDIQPCEFHMETVREELKLSDKIIFGDLLWHVVGERE